jgi:hypothetical protein
VNTIYDAAMKLLNDTYRAATAEAYDNRHSMRWVQLGEHFHAVLAEHYQRTREAEYESCGPLIRAEFGDPRAKRAADGTAPPLSLRSSACPSRSCGAAASGGTPAPCSPGT